MVRKKLTMAKTFPNINIIFRIRIVETEDASRHKMHRRDSDASPDQKEPIM